MADEISPAEYRRLVNENAELTQRAKSLEAEAARKGDRLKAERADKEAILARAAEAEKARDAAIGRVQEYENAPPDAKDRQIDALRGELRTIRHQSKFNERAKALSAREDGLADLWTLSGYRPESDEIDEQAIDSAIGEALRQRPYLLASDPAASGGRGADDSGKPGTSGLRPAVSPGPGYQRGAPNGAPLQPASPAAAARDRLTAMGAQPNSSGVVKMF
jgi:hypothetical protein